MFELLPKPVSDEIKDITAARIELWRAMNAHVLTCVGELARLNMDTLQKFTADTLASMNPLGCTQSDEAPESERYFFVPQDAGFFALYGKEAGNLCLTMQQEIIKFARKSFDETVRDVPLLSPYAVSPTASSEHADDRFVHMHQAGQADRAGNVDMSGDGAVPGHPNGPARARTARKKSQASA